MHMQRDIYDLCANDDQDDKNEDDREGAKSFVPLTPTTTCKKGLAWNQEESDSAGVDGGYDSSPDPKAFDAPALQVCM